MNKFHGKLVSQLAFEGNFISDNGELNKYNQEFIEQTKLEV